MFLILTILIPRIHPSSGSWSWPLTSI